jgi:hypothetical protein
MAKAKAKVKVDFKQLLLAKGEYFALGLAGLFLAILLITGIGKFSSAKDPTEISSGLKTSAKKVHDGIKSSTISADDEKLTEPPAWLLRKNEYPLVKSEDFAIKGPQFDPIAQPSTKRENPTVVDLTGALYQVDIVQLPFKAYDIYKDNQGELHIAVITDKATAKLDEKDRQALIKNMKLNSDKLKQRPAVIAPPAPMGPGGPGGPGPGMAGGMQGRLGAMAGRMGNSNYDTNAQRKDINYIRMDALESHMEKGEVPAMTVIPLSAAIIHMEIPYKRQIEEIKRALRLPSTDEAKLWGPIYDGYEVNRKVTVVSPDGTVDVVSDWSPYDFEDKYKENVNTRKLADTFEDDYLSYFIRYDMQLALPLPELVSELGSYPRINKLANINNAIEKLKANNIKVIPPSETAERLRNHTARNSLYTPQTGEDTGATGAFGKQNVPGMGGPGPRPKVPGSGSGEGKKPQGATRYMPGMRMEQGSAPEAPPVEVDHLLLRFVDTDVKPGYTYEYQIRLKMLNPNYQHETEVANPADATKETLYSGWTQISGNITIPPSQYLYAMDVASYRKATDETYTQKERDLLQKLQVKDGQAVIEMCRWLPEVKLDGGKREPVGAWVVADMPVGRGEYVGRKTYVKLPLWSSETKSYILRDISQLAGKKEELKQHLPKGWLVNFTTSDILVDFQGGKVQTRTPSKVITEDVATEMLIVSDDGSLAVKRSLVDEADGTRRGISSIWTKWVADVEKRKEEAKSGGNDPNSFSPKPPM